MNTAIQTFTKNSFESIVENGGDYEWKVDQNKVRTTPFLVCCHSHGPKHGTAFLVGKICGTEPSADREGRHIIKISEVANIDKPKSWCGQQNPVRYTSLEELGINLSSLKFKKIEKSSLSNSLTIAQAKEGLANHYAVSQDSIEIIIKG